MPQEEPDTESLPAQLRRPEAADRLAGRLVADLLASELGGRLADDLARIVAQVAAAGAANPTTEQYLGRRVEAALAEAAADPSSLQDRLPPELVALLRELAARSYSPKRTLVLAVLDREPVRKLIRALLVDVLVDFGRKIASVAAPLTNSRVGKGLGALGAFAGAVGAGVVGAVSGELERQVEKRAAEFADLGISRVLQKLADFASDSSLAREQAELRRALLDGLLELPVTEVAQDLRRHDPALVLERTLAALKSYWGRAESRARLAADIRALAQGDPQRTLGSVLAEMGLRAEIETALRELLVPRMRQIDWAAWLSEALDERPDAG